MPDTSGKNHTSQALYGINWYRLPRLQTGSFFSDTNTQTRPPGEQSPTLSDDSALSAANTDIRDHTPPTEIQRIQDRLNEIDATMAQNIQWIEEKSVKIEQYKQKLDNLRVRGLTHPNKQQQRDIEVLEGKLKTLTHSGHGTLTLHQHNKNLSQESEALQNSLMKLETSYLCSQAAALSPPRGLSST